MIEGALNRRLLQVLCWSVRVATERQLYDGLGVTVPRRSFRQRLSRLASRRLVGRSTAVAGVVPVTGPLVCWEPGCPQANWDTVAWTLKKRWNRTEPARVLVTWATRTAAALVGGVGGRLRPIQLQHDLGTSAVYFARKSFVNEGRWVGEDALRTIRPNSRRGKHPDAAILDDQDRLVRAIEFGGKYSATRLKAFHDHFAGRDIPYEVW